MVTAMVEQCWDVYGSALGTRHSSTGGEVMFNYHYGCRENYNPAGNEKFIWRNCIGHKRARKQARVFLWRKDHLRFLITIIQNYLKITGAGQGLGRELAIQFAELGATVICWDIDARRNNAVVNQIRSKDGECFAFTIDVTVREQVSTLAARMRRQLSDVSMVVSNAGAFSCSPITSYKPDAIAKIIEINLMAHFWIIQAFLPNMIEKRHGHIVAINSSAGLLPCADMVPYCAAKFGLRGNSTNSEVLMLVFYHFSRPREMSLVTARN
ncbi:unnamed protein product [Parnassius apollo]|uniref:(apollo) hypothetical protein n=1 Tax=Parnassius apollo TaxID=110799 RepID=A0A8S3WRL0_PARAO|nr:unnamed protein product [Parnassius apollo]